MGQRVFAWVALILLLAALVLLGATTSSAGPPGPVKASPPAGDATSAAKLAPLPSVTGTPTCVPIWSIVPSPNHLATDNFLYAVSAAAPGDTWAVGYHATGGIARTLTLHWDGEQWNIVPSPNAEARESILVSVSASAPNDVWAVGYIYDDIRDQLHTLTMHWDGEQWSIVPSPNAISIINLLTSVSASAPDDVWAVGYSYDNIAGVDRPLVLHWNGSQWNTVTDLPPELSDVRLGEVSAITSNDVWASGINSTGGAAVLHWDGTAWTVVPAPTPFFTALHARAPNDVWAMWYEYELNEGHVHAIRWNGVQWEEVPTNMTTFGSLAVAEGITAIGPDDAWAVGIAYGNGFAFRWSGTGEWWRVPVPDPNGGYTSLLMSVSAAAADDVWAVGWAYSLQSNLRRTYIVHYAGECAATTPTPTATPTPDTCATQFSDVPPGSAFYPYVRCLACRDVIGGYADGTFRPNNPVTRGQLAKIVSNAARFDDDPGPQLFEDVPPGSAFYPYVQRMANRGYVSGYACGQSLSEPCVPPDNRPYFRPGGGATRGQIAKIIALAAGMAEPSGPQQFEDVPPASTFYTYTQQLVGQGIVEGYACGSAGEPCVPPGNRPYFRPNAGATRGQTSKMVSAAFFRECVYGPER
jgi:hypothetical protein